MVDAKKGKKDHHNKGHGNGHGHGRKGDWQTVEGEGYGGEYSYVVANGKSEPSATCRWRAGAGKTYQVLVTWVADPANASSTTWTIADERRGILLSISDVDQTELRADATLAARRGSRWRSSPPRAARWCCDSTPRHPVAAWWPTRVAVVEVGETVESGQNGGDGDVGAGRGPDERSAGEDLVRWLVDLLGGRFGKAVSERFRARDQALADCRSNHTRTPTFPCGPGHPGL